MRSASMCALMLALRSICAQETTVPRSFDTSAGLGWVPVALWGSGQFVSAEDLLHLDFRAAAFTSYEGSLWLRRSGVRIGVTADFEDNLVGRLYRILGYVGIRDRFYLRIQSGRLSGTAAWKGDPVAGQPPEVRFDNTYVNIDLLYWIRADLAGGAYVGLGYTSYEVPMQVNTEVLGADEEIYFGNPVYQEDASMRSYSFLFGFDTLDSALMLGRSIGWTLWAYTQDRFGMGAFVIREETYRRAEAANPGREALHDPLITAVIDLDMILGVKRVWESKKTAVKLALGLGYSFAGQMVICYGGGDLDEITDLRLNPAPYIFRHGPVVKIALRW